MLAASEHAGALLVVLENLYGYGPTGGTAPVTPSTRRGCWSASAAHSAIEVNEFCCDVTGQFSQVADSRVNQ